MSLSVKVLEKQAGTLSRTAIASLGGLITSESTGYTGVACSATLVTTLGNHYWLMQGTSGTSFSLNYVTATDCAADKKVYIKGTLRTTTASVEGLYLYVTGSTGGSTLAAARYSPAQYTNYDLSAVVTLDGTFSGKVTLKWMLGNTPDATGSFLVVYNWTAIDLTAQFGAGDEPLAADLDTFFAWRWDGWTVKNHGLYGATGDKYFYASKIASHGLSTNDVVENGYYWPVYALNTDWVIMPYWADSDPTGIGSTSLTLDCWMQTERKPRNKTLNMNIRNDVEASASMVFDCTSVWQPEIGMSVFIYDDTECIFSGYISKMTITDINATNWEANCEIVSFINLLSWTMNTTNYDFNGMTTQNALDAMIMYDANISDKKCFWRGEFDAGITHTISTTDQWAKTIYELATGFCKTAGMVLTITPDRRLFAKYQTTTPANAPRNITDAVSPDVWNMSYTEDLSGYGNDIIISGGYTSDGTLIMTGYEGASALTPAFGDDKCLIFSDPNQTDDSYGSATGEYLFNRYGLVKPGTFSFTTSDLDYRPGQKISVDIDRLGMTAAKTMLIDSVTIYDADGVNLMANVACSNRDSTTFAAASTTGTNAFMSDMAQRLNDSARALKQDAGTFTPELEGSTAAGTWDYTTQSGYYIRHGNMVHVNAHLVISTISDSPTGNLILKGLPFAAMELTHQYLDVYSSGLAWGTGATVARLIIAPEATTGTFYGAQNNGAPTVVAVGNATAGDAIRVTGWYQITP